MFWPRKVGARRQGVRQNRPDTLATRLRELKAQGAFVSMVLAGAFALVAISIVTLREEVVPWRPGQFVPQDILSRVDFRFQDKEQLRLATQQARESEPRVYRRSAGDAWAELEINLLELPDKVANKRLEDLSPDLVRALDLTTSAGALNVLAQYRDPTRRQEYNKAVTDYIQALRPMVIVPREQRKEELGSVIRRTIRVQNVGLLLVEDCYGDSSSGELLAKLNLIAPTYYPLTLWPKIVSYTVNTMRPTHEMDEGATTAAQNRAEALVDPGKINVQFQRNQILVQKGVLTERGWQLLKSENDEFYRQLGKRVWEGKIGMMGMVLLCTFVLGWYVWRYQRRVIRNHARGLGIAVLLLSMLLLAQLAAIGTGPLYIFGLAPTILVAMILTIAYDQRFALGMAMLHGVLVTLALDQTISFYLVLLVGCFVSCFLLDEIRTRSKLIEVGGATAIAMMIAAAAAGALSLDPPRYIIKNCLYSGAAGLSAGFVILGILPFIEKAFRITTAMSLLELADASQPLLKRLALEAPGTYNHSLQVATISEAAADAIGANSLLCRVAAYYHDIGKINKADYFIENQSDGRNRHINLSPSVSLLIIIGHVKDGLEMAKEYNLPTLLFPFIQQHHGTMLVEYFYYQACTRQEASEEDLPKISDTEYRYPGPKPKSREIAILMIADAVESAMRTMQEPNASRIEALVHELIMKRLKDGQFDECDLTFRDLEHIERACVKTLLGIYHGRVAYPSTAAMTQAPGTGAAAGQVRSA